MRLGGTWKRPSTPGFSNWKTWKLVQLVWDYRVSPETRCPSFTMQVSNEIIGTVSGYTGNQHVWASDYDTLAPDWTPDTHRRTVNKLWGQFQPKYKILHAYVRMKLSRFPAYKGLIHRCGHIPLHLLNNLFGQTWTNIDSITKPYPKVKSVDATEEMRRQVLFSGCMKACCSTYSLPNWVARDTLWTR